MPFAYCCHPQKIHWRALGVILKNDRSAAVILVLSNTSYFSTDICQAVTKLLIMFIPVKQNLIPFFIFHSLICLNKDRMSFLRQFNMGSNFTMVRYWIFLERIIMSLNFLLVLLLLLHYPVVSNKSCRLQ